MMTALGMMTAQEALENFGWILVDSVAPQEVGAVVSVVLGFGHIPDGTKVKIIGLATSVEIEAYQLATGTTRFPGNDYSYKAIAE